MVTCETVVSPVGWIALIGTVLCDNQVAFRIVSNSVFHEKTNRNHHHFIMEKNSIEQNCGNIR